MGNEAWGLPAGTARLCWTGWWRCRMYGQAESLNLSTAAAVFLYASATAQRLTSQRVVHSLNLLATTRIIIPRLSQAHRASQSTSREPCPGRTPATTPFRSRR